MAQYTYDFGSAIKAGLTPDQINQYLAAQKAKGNSYQLTNTPQATPQQSQQPAPKANFIADALPTVGSIVGGIGGALIPGLGETGLGEVGGSAIGSGLGETLKESIEGKPLDAGNIAEQAALGGVGAGVGVGAAKIGAGILGKLGEGEAVNGLNLTRLQHNTLSIKNGEPVAKSLMNNGMAGVNAEGLSNGISKVQNTFDSIAKNNNVPIDQNAFLAHATTALDTLKTSSVPSDQALAPQVEEALGNVMDKVANGKVTTLADLNAERQAFDKATKDNQFGSAPWGVNRTVGDILRSTAYDSANASNAVGPNGESLQDIGANLRKLYNISNIADKRVGQGNSAGVMSVSNMLLGGLGALAGAPAGPMGSIAGYAATTGARKLLATQPVAKALSSTFTNAGKGLTTPVGMGVAAGAGAGVSSALPVTPPGTSQQSDNNQNPNQSSTLPSSPQAAFAGNNSTISSTGSQVLPSNPNAAFQDTPPSDFMKGYTVNGTPVDPATANLIWQVVNYHIDPTKMTSLKNNERERLINLASQYDPTYNSSQFGVIQKTREDYTSGKSAQTIRSLNTAIGHLNTLAQAGQGLNNGSLPFLNSAKNAISQGTGQPQVNRFNTAANAVAGEMAQVFKNSGATDDEIKSWKSTLDPNMSPQQLQVAINQMISLMGSRLSALQSQYSANVGKPANFSFISPESQQILQGLGVDPNSLMSQ